MSGKSRKKAQKPASVSGTASSTATEESATQFDSQLLSMAAKYRLHPQYLQTLQSFPPPQSLQNKPESSTNAGQDSASGGAGLPQGLGAAKTSPPSLTHNHTVTDVTGQQDEGEPPTTQEQQPTSNGQPPPGEEDPSKFTLNPSYNFNQAVLSGLPFTPNIPQGAVPAAFTVPPSQESSSKATGKPPPSSRYLLPSIFAQNQSYAEASPEYLMSQEALQNHMIDFAKQQALVTVLEGLVMQNEAQKGEEISESRTHQEEDAGGGEERLRNNASLKTNDLEVPLEAKPSNDDRHSASSKPINLQQSLIGVSTALGNLQVPFVDGVSGESPTDLLRPPGSNEDYVIDKRYLEAFQSQMLASLEQAGLCIPSLVASNLEGSAAPQPPSSESMNSTHNSTQPTIPRPQTPPLSSAQTPYPLDSHGTKPPSHHLALQSSATTDVTREPQQEPPLSSSFMINANFPEDIPPPTDLIPDHVSVM